MSSRAISRIVNNKSKTTLFGGKQPEMPMIIPYCTGKLCACNYGIYGCGDLQQTVWVFVLPFDLSCLTYLGVV